MIGCGWLGKALVTALVEQKYDVIATSTQQAKQNAIKALGATAEIIFFSVGRY